MFLERVTGAGKTSELAVHTPVIETNGEAKIVPHIIQEKLRSTKNKINLHQPPIIAARTSPTVIHMRHVHMAIENAKPLFQNELNQGVSSFIPFSHTDTDQWVPHGHTPQPRQCKHWNHRRPTEFVHLERHCPKKDPKFHTHGELHHLWPTKLEGSKQTKQSVSDQHGMTRSKNVHSKHGIPNRHILSAIGVTHKFRRHNGHFHLKEIVCAVQVFQNFSIIFSRSLLQVSNKHTRSKSKRSSSARKSMNLSLLRILCKFLVTTCRVMTSDRWQVSLVGIAGSKPGFWSERCIQQHWDLAHYISSLEDQRWVKRL